MIFKRELKKNFKSFLVFVIICSLLVTYVVSIAPKMGTDIQKILDLKLPKQFQVAFGMKGLNFAQPESVYAMIFSYLFLIISIYISGIFSTVVSKEFSDKTAEFLFSLPKTRIQIIRSKLFAVFLYSIITLIFLFGISWMSFLIFIGNGVDIFPIFLMALAWLIGGLTFGTIGFLISSFFKNARTISAISMGFIIAMFMLQVVISINHDIDFLKYICPFEWFKGSEILQTSDFSIIYSGIALVIMVACIVAGTFRYKRMEVLV